MNFEKSNMHSPMMRLLVWRAAERRGASRRWCRAGMRRAVEDLLRASAQLAWFAIEMAICVLCSLAVVFVLWMIGGAR